MDCVGRIKHRHHNRKGIPLHNFLTLLAAMALFGTPAFAQEAGSRDTHGQLDFEGRFIVSVQDADMVASAYVDGALGPREGRDTLAVIPLDGDPRDWRAAEVFASNSVAGPPAAPSPGPPNASKLVMIPITVPRIPSIGAAVQYGATPLLRQGSQCTIKKLKQLCLTLGRHVACSANH